MIRILHLEDDEDILEICQMALELSGKFELMQCTSGDDAISRAEAFRPDVLLLDVMLPGKWGPDVLQDLRKLPELKNVPAIFLTARALHAEMKELRDLGAVAVISKPFDPTTLDEQILAAIGKAATQQRKPERDPASCTN